MRRNTLKTLAACVFLGAVISACAVPETNQLSGPALEQPSQSECPTPTPQKAAMVDAMEDGAGAAAQAAAAPAEAISSDVIMLTDQQVLSREGMLDRVNAGPQRPGIVEGESLPPSPGSASTVAGELTSTLFLDDSQPAPCP